MPGDRRVDFYMVRGTEAEQLEQYACRIVAKAFRHAYRVVCHVPDLRSAKALDAKLWSFDADSFISHEIQTGASPVWRAGIQAIITCEQLPAIEGPTLLVNLSSEMAAHPGFDRIAELFLDQEAYRRAARERYRAYQRQGDKLHFHQVGA